MSISAKSGIVQDGALTVPLQFNGVDPDILQLANILNATEQLPQSDIEDDIFYAFSESPYSSIEDEAARTIYSNFCEADFVKKGYQRWIECAESQRQRRDDPHVFTEFVSGLAKLSKHHYHLLCLLHCSISTNSILSM